MSRPITESKYFRAMNFYLFAGAALLAWAPALPLLTNGVNQVAAAQDDPIEPPLTETPRNPTAPVKSGTSEPAPAAEPAPSSEPATDPIPTEPDPTGTPNNSQDDLLNSTPSQPATPPSLAGGSDPEQALTEARAAMAAFSVFSVVAHWNDLYWPMVVITTTDLAPPPLGMLLFANAESGANYGALMAGATLITLPMVIAFLLARKQFIQGITMTGFR